MECTRAALPNQMMRRKKPILFAYIQPAHPPRGIGCRIDYHESPLTKHQFTGCDRDTQREDSGDAMSSKYTPSRTPSPEAMPSTTHTKQPPEEHIKTKTVPVQDNKNDKPAIRSADPISGKKS
jgi:hypothetical protein